MESVLKSEIFFFISSIALVLVTVVFLVVGFYFAKMMRNFAKISDRLKETVDGAASSLEEVGENIKESPIYTFFFGKKKKGKK